MGKRMRIVALGSWIPQGHVHDVLQSDWQRFS